MFLVKEDIRVRRDEIFVQLDQFSDGNLGQASYDLCVGDEVYLSEEGVPKHLGPDCPYVVLPPGQFALVKTFERIRIPRDLIGMISIRSKFKFQGLINISGFHVDPTYEGNLIFAVQNVGPNEIRLRYRDPAFMIMLAKLTRELKGPGRSSGYDRIQLDHMAQLGGGSVTLSKLQGEMDKLKLSLKIYGSLVIALFGAIVALILRYIRT